MIIKRHFKEGYLRPIGRGLTLEGEYFEDIIQDALGVENKYSYSGGSKLEDIQIEIIIGKAKKG